MPQDPLYWKYGDSLDAIRVPGEPEIAFFAGFFEGEGSATPSRKYESLSVKVNQKDPEMLYRMRELWGGSVKFWVTRNKKASPTFEGYESWRNPIYQWTITGDRARLFLRQIYPFLSSRRKAQVDRCSLMMTGRMSRVSPRMSPERKVRREQMDAHEKYLESKAYHRAQNLEHCRQKDREFQRNKHGYKPRVSDLDSAQKELVN